jgi:altronate dehydratase small subunit
LSIALIIHPKDNVAVALDDIPANATVAILDGTRNVQMNGVNVLQDVPFAHKIAIEPISRGHAVMKYGAPIACATAGIAVGEWVHTHNAASCVAAKGQEGSQ